MGQVRQGSATTTKRIRPNRTMRTVLSLASILAMVIGSPTFGSATDDPFIPPSGAPDYVVTYTQSGVGSRIETTTVTHHGSWTRVDKSDAKSAFVVFSEGTRRIAINSWPNDADGIGLFSAEWGERVDARPWQTDERRTTGRRMVAGETCTVWLVRHSLEQKLEQMSCVTEDGIEVASSVETDSGPLLANEAVRVERREVRLDEVSPAKHFFDPAFWLKKVGLQGSVADTSDDRTPNDEVILMRSDESSPHPSFSKEEIHRRYGARISIMKFRADGGWQRELTIGNRLSFAFESSATGTYRRLGIAPFVGAMTRRDRRKKLDPAPDLIVGESCTWYDDNPGLQDASFFHCETSDGMVLKRVSLSRGRLSEMLTAKVVRRGKNQLADFLPPSDLSKESQWRQPGDQISK